MFSAVRRENLRTTLLRRAEDDARIVGAAVTGSRAEGREDAWSDIDLFFGVDAAVPVGDVAEDWARYCYAELGAVHHFVLTAGQATYRAFVLDDGLQVDLGFAPAAAFGPLGAGAFDVVFGEPAPRVPLPPDTDFLVGMVWHHLLHARTFIARGQLWAAEHWISALREVTLSLAAIRHGLPHSYARGADALPAAVTRPLADGLVRELTAAECTRALRLVADTALAEVRQATPDADRIVQVLRRAVDELDAPA